MDAKVLGAIAILIAPSLTVGDGLFSASRWDHDTIAKFVDGAVEVEHRITMNRPAAFEEFLAIDTNEDKSLSDAEREAFFKGFEREFLRDFRVELDQRMVTPSQVEMVLEPPLTKVFRMRYAFESKPELVRIFNESFLVNAGSATMKLDDTTGRRSLEWRRMPPRVDMEVYSLQSWVWPVLFLGVALSLYGAIVKDSGKSRAMEYIGWTISVVSVWVLLQSNATLESDGAIAQFETMHRTAYEAFSSDTESATYDRLSEVLGGAMLERAYEEFQLSEMAAPEKEMRIEAIRPISSELVAMAPQRFRVRHQWIITGTVSHLQHTHARRLKMQGIFDVQRGKNGWRIVDVELDELKRMRQ